MSRPVSTIESHPQRGKIIDAIVNGQTLRQIAAWTVPPVSTAAICRFKQTAYTTARRSIDAVKTAIANNDSDLGIAESPGTAAVTRAATKAALVAATDPFILRIEELRAERQTVKDACLQSMEQPDVSTWAKLDGNDLKELELHAKLAGRLNGDAGGLTVNIVVPMTAQPAVEPQDFEVIDIKAAT